jgi:PhnB protein
MASVNKAAGAGLLTAYIAVRDAKSAIAFYKKAFGAEELFRLTDPGDGRIGHAELRLGQSILMLSDEYPDFGARSPEAIGGSPVKLHLDVPELDPVFERAVAAGATVLRKPEKQFHGCRQAMIADPFGYSWFISEKVDEVSPAEMQARWNAMAK